MTTEVVRSAPRRISRWWGGWRVATRLACSNMRSTPGRVAFTAGALATGIALMGGMVGEPVLVTIGLTLVTITALSSARIPDPVRLRTSAMLSLVGAPRSVRRRIVVVDVGLGAVLSVVPGGFLSLLVANVAGNHGNAGPATACGVSVPIVIAVLVGGRGEEVVFRPLQNVPRARLSGLVRLLAAGLFVAVGVLAPGTSRSWFDLDLTLIPGIVLVGVGLSLIAPMLLLAVGRLLSWAGRRASMHLAGSLVVDRRRALAPAACLVAAGTAALVAQAVLGLGLAEREADRRASFDLAAGTRSNQVVVDVSASSRQSVLGQHGLRSVQESNGLRPQDVAAIGQAAPEGIVGPFEIPYAEALQQSGGFVAVPQVAHDGEVGSWGRSVVLATPELLRALGLERYEPDVSAGRALVLDPAAATGDGSVALRMSTWFADLAAGQHDPPVRVPGRIVPGFEKASRLPAVLLSEPVSQTTLGFGEGRIVEGAVVRLPRPASTADIDAIRLAVPGSLTSIVLRGDALDVERRDEGRLDAADSVAVRTSTDALGGVLLVGVLGLAALLVGLRFAALANRAEDDLFEVVGAPSSTLRRVAAWQGALVTVIGAGLGLAVGLLGTASGIARYNSWGRGELPPIPFGVPGTVLVGLAVLPLVAAVVAWASAGRRPAVDPVLLAERLGW